MVPKVRAIVDLSTIRMQRAIEIKNLVSGAVSTGEHEVSGQPGLMRPGLAPAKVLPLHGESPFVNRLMLVQRQQHADRG